jgi:hypothetical protein
LSMKDKPYILEAYKLDYVFIDKNVHVVTVTERALQPTLNYLFINGITHSRPRRYPNEPKYYIYVVTDNDNELEKLENELKSIWEVNDISIKRNSAVVDTLDEYVKGDMVYRALRHYVYKKLGFRRGSGSKLYNPNMVIDSYKGDLNVYRAYVTGFDVLNNVSYLMLDAARKLEFMKTLADFEAQDPDIVNRLYWVKIQGSTVSFYIRHDFDWQRVNFDDAVKGKVMKTLEYIARTRFIPMNLDNIEISDRNDLIALVPRSGRLLQELHEGGLTYIIHGREVVLLPKSILTPVASLENIVRLLSANLEVKIAPTKRHNEIQELIGVLKSGVKTNTVNILVDSSPLRINIREVTLNELYLSFTSNRYQHQDVKDIAFRWNPYDKLKTIISSLEFYILHDKSSDKIANDIREELAKNLNMRPSIMKIDFKPDTLERTADYIADNTKERSGVILVIGPRSVNEREDKELRRVVERIFRSKGLFCWYVSTAIKKGDIVRVILNKVKVIMKELTTRLQLFSHKLLPLELLTTTGQVEIINGIVAMDATTVGIEETQLRVATILLLMNIHSGRYAIKTSIETSTRGENYVLAKTISRALDLISSTPTIIYINRARPEDVLDDLDEKEVEELLQKAIIIGATKTHTYPRILKNIGNNQYANPEIGVYYNLYTVNRRIQNLDAIISKYLAITTVAWSERIEGELTVKPTLLTIVAGRRYRVLDNLEKLIRYTVSLCVINNTSTWIHSLPWPLHRVDRILKNAHRLAEKDEDVLALLQKEEVVKTL